jgi:uncharacterized protein with ParB-like and HNH nuclease domain
MIAKIFNSITSTEMPSTEAAEELTITDVDELPWADDYASAEEPDTQIDEYDLTATPNDFNVSTIFNFIEAGAVKVPGFQRNFVWDIRRASKLIESLILGLPVPQVFLYEEDKNSFLVVDGQQRLMSVYYFVKGRFPRSNSRARLRMIALEKGCIPEEVLEDDELFQPFSLSIPSRLQVPPNKFHGKKYTTLGEYRRTLDLRPIRNVIVKQNAPKDDDSSVYEMFNRLNTGGVNLSPQEIRSSIYHSEFFEALYRINGKEVWRKIINKEQTDLHGKDVEILLRAFALLLDLASYKPSMVKFLNQFAKKAKSYSSEDIEYLERLFDAFGTGVASLKADIFINPRSKRLNVALFESIFYATCKNTAKNGLTEIILPTLSDIQAVANDEKWKQASTEATTDKANVTARMARACVVIESSHA